MAEISIGEAAICLAASCLVSPLLGAAMAVGYMIENHSKENTDHIIAAINGKSAELLSEQQSKQLSEQQFISRQSTEYQKNYYFHKNNDCEKPDWMKD